MTLNADGWKRGGLSIRAVNIILDLPVGQSFLWLWVTDH